MKIEEDKEVPSSSGVSDGDEEDEDEDSIKTPYPGESFSVNTCSKFGVLNPNVKSEHSPRSARMLTGVESTDDGKIHLEISCGCDVSCSVDASTDSNSSSSCVSTDIKNSYVFVSSSGRCSYTDLHQTSLKTHVFGKQNLPQSDESYGSSQTLGSIDSSQSCLRHSQFLGHSKATQSIPCTSSRDRQKFGSKFRRPFDSSDESEDDRERPPDEHYEGSEENEDDEFLRNGMFDKSRFNHYQKLLKEHEFVEGGDEEEYLRFLYHRHLYYNQLNKISPKNIKLFRRLEEMQNARYCSAGGRISSKFGDDESYFESSNLKSDPRYRKLTRRSKIPDPFPNSSRFSSSRLRSFPRSSPSSLSQGFGQSSRFSRSHGEGDEGGGRGDRGSSPHRSSSTRNHSTCSTSTFAHLDNFLTIPFLLLAFLSFLLVVESVGACRLSEFTCGSNDCIRADAYCDGETDCPDRSDEPRDCSPCNRTFYGDNGKNYEVSVKKPQDMLTTFTCHLTFIAGGESYGDLVQLTIQEFSLGDFFSYNSGCPQGWMQISERDRPYSDGYWCGDGKGFNIYYSETSTVTLTLKQFIPMEYIHFENLFQAPFKFRLSYKTLKLEQAVLRYGRHPHNKHRGDLAPGSLCDRFFLNCDEKHCAVQSPNYPGMYPRHITCHYILRQTRYVPYARPLISVLQKNRLKFNVKDRSALPSQGVFPPGLQIWGACDLVHDFLMIYDGNSTDAPLLLKVCGSGILPPVTSTGAEMLVVFTTSRFDEPTSESFMPKKMGFELDVKVNYLEMDSREFARDRRCVFHIYSTSNRTGDVTSVVNTQPRNSTCVYVFHGEPHEVIWIHFRKYEILPKLGHYMMNLTECINPLFIYEGNLYDTRLPFGTPQKLNKLADHCTTRHPPMCAREYLPALPGLASYVKSCTRNESYVANGPKMTVVQFYNESTAALGMDFVLKYEFVSTRPGYRPSNDSRCDQEAISDGYSHRSNRFFSPRTSVLYGRWGHTQLKCQYRLLAAADEVVRITITKFRTVSRYCYTTINNFTGSYDCETHGRQFASLTVSEFPWNDIEVPRLCTCDNKVLPIRYESRSRELRLKFDVNNMDDTHDFPDFMFEAQYEFIKKLSCKKDQRLQGTNGEITFHHNNVSADRPCNNYPWLLQTSDARKSIYFRIRGYDHLDKNCSSSTRLLIFKVGRLRPVGVLCPDPNSKNVVELFSFAWRGSGALEEQSTDKLVLEVTSRDNKNLYPQVGPHTLSWLQVSPARQYDWAAEGIVRGCEQECPELGVCISEELWCDGIHHCPSGHDELIAHCFFQSVPWAYIGVGSTLSVILLFGVIIYGGIRLRAATKKKTRSQAIPTLPTASESLFSSDKDAAERDGHVSSTYSLDYSEMDYVTTL